MPRNEKTCEEEKNIDIRCLAAKVIRLSEIGYAASRDPMFIQIRKAVEPYRSLYDVVFCGSFADPDFEIGIR